MRELEKKTAADIKKRITINSIFSLLSISSRLIANVFVFWIIARFFNAATFGQFTYAYTLATTFILFADFGFDILLTTEVAKNRTHAEIIFKNYFSIKFILTCLSFVAMWIFILLKSHDEQGFLIAALFSSFMFLTTMTNFLNALLRGFERLDYESIVSLLSNIWLIILVVVLIIINADPFFFALSFVFTRGLGFVTSIFFAKRMLSRITLKISLENFKTSLGKTFDYGMIILFAGLLFQLDTILIGLFLDDYQVGVYQAAVKIVMLPLIIPSILFNAILPVLAKLHSESETKWESLGYFINKILFGLSIPISIIIFIYPEQILDIVYGRGKFYEAIPILKIFSFVVFVRFFLETYGYMLSTSNRQKVQMLVLLLAMSTNLLLDLLAIPKYGIWGIAIATLITNIIIAIGFCYTNLDLFKKWALNYRIFLMLLVSAVTILFINFFWKANIWLGSLIVFVTFSLAAVTFYFDKNEKKLITPKKMNA